MGIQLKNNASGTLATAISASDTGIVLTTGNGASFPVLGLGDYFYATLESTGGTFEVVRVTARSGDSMTVVRAQEGSTANSFAAGSRLEMRVTAQAVIDIASQYAGDADQTLRNDLAAATGSSLVGFQQAGLGTVLRTTQAKLRETVSVKDFGAVGDGVTDDTAAIQAAIDYANTAGNVIFLSAGEYRVTDTLNMPRETQISGEHVNMAARGFGTDPKGTTIRFAPSSAKPLFVATGTYSGSFRRGYLIENLYIVGNSTSNTGNSTYAIDADKVTSSVFRNIAIQYFRTGVRCFGTINNRFEYVRVIDCYDECVLYAGGTATTDSWDQCYISNAPIGINTVAGSTSLGIRFHKCVFETFTLYGVQITKECFNWSFIDCYAEDVPTSGVSNPDAAMFKLGYTGTTASTNPIATIIGGYFAGPNDGTRVGYGIDADAVSGVILTSPFFSRFNFALRATSNTLNQSIVINGFNWVQQNGAVTGITGKFQGYYSVGAQNSGNIRQDGNFGGITFLSVVSNSIRPRIGTSVHGDTDNVNSLGRIDIRWKEVWVSSGYIVTTPDGTKNYRIAVDNSGNLTTTLL